MFTEIRDVTPHNKSQILSLHIAKEQLSFIESTEQCLQEAKEDTRYIPVGLYKGDDAVGFAMYGLFSDDAKGQRVWLDRYFIDENYQGQGLDKYFLQQLIDFLASKYNCSQIYLSVYDYNEVTIRLYEKFGFYFNGELDTLGEKVMVKDLNHPA